MNETIKNLKEQLKEAKKIESAERNAKNKENFKKNSKKFIDVLETATSPIGLAKAAVKGINKTSGELKEFFDRSDKRIVDSTATEVVEDSEDKCTL